MRKFIYSVILSIAYKRTMYWHRKSTKGYRKIVNWANIHHMYYEKFCEISSDGKE